MAVGTGQLEHQKTSIGDGFIARLKLYGSTLSLHSVTVVPYMQTAWIWMRRRVTRRLIQIQAV